MKNLETPVKTGRVGRYDTSRSTQSALRTWQAWLEQSEFVEAEKKPVEVYTKQELSQLLKHLYLSLVPKVPPNELFNC